MKMIKCADVVSRLSGLIQTVLCRIDDRTLTLLQRQKTTGLEKFAVDAILENAALAAETQSFACQDTGLAVIFCDLGSNAHLDGDLEAAIIAGVRQGYAAARKSVCDPLTRFNSGDNTPPVIHYRVDGGEALTLTFLAKGAGSENMSAIYMLTPAKGEDGIVNAVVDCVKNAGANPCPPIIVGVGVGGDFEQCALLSKRALLRPAGMASGIPQVAALEQRILKEVNALGIGAQGFGGDLTALAVAVETFPTHIGMLPVAINIQCHSVRHGSITL